MSPTTFGNTKLLPFSAPAKHISYLNHIASQIGLPKHFTTSRKYPTYRITLANRFFFSVSIIILKTVVSIIAESPPWCCHWTKKCASNHILFECDNHFQFILIHHRHSICVALEPDRIKNEIFAHAAHQPTPVHTPWHATLQHTASAARNWTKYILLFSFSFLVVDWVLFASSLSPAAARLIAHIDENRWADNLLFRLPTIKIESMSRSRGPHKPKHIILVVAEEEAKREEEKKKTRHQSRKLNLNRIRSSRSAIMLCVWRAVLSNGFPRRSENLRSHQFFFVSLEICRWWFFFSIHSFGLLVARDLNWMFEWIYDSQLMQINVLVPFIFI